MLSYKISIFCEQILKICANDASGKMLQYVYSIRLQGEYDWQPKSDYIVEREHDGQII